MSKAYEGGIRPYRLEFARESQEGVIPTEPDFQLFSDNVTNFDPQIDPGTEGQRGLGDVDFKDHFTGTGSFGFSVEYDLQQWFSASGDAAYDGIVRDADNTLPASHTVVRRMEQHQIDADNTVNGSSSKDTRQYLVFIGGKISTVTITGDPTSPQPVRIQLDYLTRKGVPYQFDQPDEMETLTVRSSDAADTSQSVTIAEEDGSNSNSADLDGTTEVAVGDYSSYDAVQLDAETEGNVTVAVSGGDDLAVLHGKNAYDFDEGELGVPTISGGSRASSIDSSYEVVQGDVIERPDGVTLADEINSHEITIENNVSEDATTSGPRPVVVANERVITSDATVFGETEYFDNLVESLTSNKNTHRWQMDGGTLEVIDEVVTDVGGTEEPSQGVKEVSVSAEGEGINIA